jgi:hypothetical protein
MKGRRVARILVRPEPPASSAGESTPA